MEYLSADFKSCISSNLNEKVILCDSDNIDRILDVCRHVWFEYYEEELDLIENGGNPQELDKSMIYFITFVTMSCQEIGLQHPNLVTKITSLYTKDIDRKEECARSELRDFFYQVYNNLPDHMKESYQV